VGKRKKKGGERLFPKGETEKKKEKKRRKGNRRPGEEEGEREGNPLKRLTITFLAQRPGEEKKKKRKNCSGAGKKGLIPPLCLRDPAREEKEGREKKGETLSPSHTKDEKKNKKGKKGD